MHRYFFTTKDSFINSGSNSITGEDFKDKNTGQDEILELKKVFDDKTFSYQTRVLLQFDTNKIESYISSSVLPNDYQLNLRLYETDGTSGANKWFSGVNSNYGMLVRISGSRETSSGSFEDLKFFSRQTNTIYSPKIELKWDDHLPATGSNTGSLTTLDVSGNSENYLYPIHLREAYKENETVKFRFGARKRYIQKSFTTSVQTVSGSFIPHGKGTYSIIDMATNESVVPFSAYTTMSCDETSNYFKQDLDSFEPNRAYKILIKVNHDDGQEIIYDNDFEFILRT